MSAEVRCFGKAATKLAVFREPQKLGISMVSMHRQMHRKTTKHLKHDNFESGKAHSTLHSTTCLRHLHWTLKILNFFLIAAESGSHKLPSHFAKHGKTLFTESCNYEWYWCLDLSCTT